MLLCPCSAVVFRRPREQHRGAPGQAVVGGGAHIQAALHKRAPAGYAVDRVQKLHLVPIGPRGSLRGHAQSEPAGRHGRLDGG